uniref:Uncharacterized protein n=1 Tax=uncultured marine virus TaxID=186617 RepID=A0A0F7LB88_9VIRU|nr:hypothetical protein TM1040_1655 [uncultured marine virus]
MKMSGILSVPTAPALARLRDVNDAAKADQFVLAWDSATSKHIYIAAAGGGGGDALTTGDVFTGVHDFGGADSLEIPNGAAPTVDAAGEIAIDTTVADYTGLIKYHDGVEELTVLAVPTTNLSTTDGEVVAYNAANNELEFIDVVGPYLESTLGGAASGDVLYNDGTNWTNLAKGSDDEVLTLAAGLPSWGAAAGGSPGAVLLARCVSTGNLTNSEGTYANKSMAVSGQESAPAALAFSSDGTKCYVVGQSSDTVYQYTLSTAWDILTGSYASKSMDVSGETGIPTGLQFSSDGTKCYVMDATNDTARQYTLSTAWDISTGSYATKSMDVSGQESGPAGLRISSDGTKCYVVGGANDTVYQYTLSTAWDISTGSYASKSMDVSGKLAFPSDLAFNAAGTECYVVGSTNDSVYRYTLSTPWDISTGSYSSKSMSVNAQDYSPTGVAISADGTKCYVAGSATEKVYQYTLGTAADPSPIDGITLADGDRVLLSGQTDPLDNGVYDAVTATNPASWTRISDLATASDASGRTVAVAVGTTNSTSLWVCESPAGSAVVGTNDLTFTKYS